MTKLSWKKACSEPGKLLVLAGVVMLLGCVSPPPSVYDGYQVLPQPIGDPLILGKNIIYGVNTGPGAPSETFTSWSFFAQSRNFGAKAEMDAEIQKVVVLSLNLNAQKYSGIELRDIKLLFHKDLTSMGFGNGDRVVIGAILVGSIVLISNGSFGAQAKVELEQAAKNITQAGGTATINTNRAELKFGEDLIVAIKLVDVFASRQTKDPLIVRKRLGTAPYGYPYQVEVRHLHYPTSIKDLDENPRGHIYCVALWLLDPYIIESAGSSKQWTPYCPGVDDIRVSPPGRIQAYDPSPELQSRLPKPVIRRINRNTDTSQVGSSSVNEFALTSLQVDKLSIDFETPQGQPDSARLLNADGQITVLKTFLELRPGTLK